MCRAFINNFLSCFRMNCSVPVNFNGTAIFKMLVIVMFLLGFLLRIAYLLELQEHPEFQIPAEYQQDMGFNDNTALALATYLRNKLDLPEFVAKFKRTNEWVQKPEDYLFRPPLYTLFLAFLYFCLGDSQIGVRVGQMLMGLSAACLGYFLGKQVYGKTAGLIVFGFMLFYWPLIIYENALHSVSIAIFVGVLFLNTAFLWMRKKNFLSAGLLGIALSLYILTVTAMLPLVPVVGLWMVWVGKTVFEKGPRKNLRVVLSVGLSLAICATTVMAVTAYNYWVSGRIVIISGIAGMTLYIGNQSGSTGYLLGCDEILDRFLPEDAHSLTTDQKAARVPWPEVSEYAKQVAMETIRKHPGWFMKLSLKRAFLFWTPKEISQNITEYCDKLFSRTLVWVPGNFICVFPLAILGLILYLYLGWNVLLQWRRNTYGFHLPYSEMQHVIKLTLILATMLVWYGPYCFLWVSAHFRAPILPHLFAFGAFGICTSLDLFKERRWKPLLLGTGIGVTVVTVMAMIPVSYDEDIQKWLYFRVRHYEESNRPDKALEIAERVVRRAPYHVFARRIYAQQLLNNGYKEAALAAFKEVLSDIQEATARADTYEIIGLLSRELGDNQAAQAAFQKAVALDSERPASLHGLGNIAFESGDYEQAVRYLEHVKRLEPERSNTYFLLGMTYAALGEVSKAETAYREGMNVNPKDVWPAYGLANLLYSMGRQDDACLLAQQTLELETENTILQEAVSTFCLSGDSPKKVQVQETPDTH